MSLSSREKILAAARHVAEAHGYNGINFRDLADEVGMKAASIYHHFPSKAELGAAIAKRYWEDSSATLARLSSEFPDPVRALHHYPSTFRKTLENGNRLSLASYLAVEYEDLPEPVKIEMQLFADVNVAWLSSALSLALGFNSDKSEKRARAVFAAISGAQVIARSRADISLFDALIESYRSAGLVPA